MPANYDEFSLTSPVIPDPWEWDDQTIWAGTGDETVDVSYLGGSCTGYANDKPDFEVDYTAGSYDLLRFYFVADDPNDDPVMIINDPAGVWHCEDDSYGTYNPTIDFPFPSSGVYDIWVGSLYPDDNHTGRFFITELDGNHP